MLCHGLQFAVLVRPLWGGIYLEVDEQPKSHTIVVGRNSSYVVFDAAKNGRMLLVLLPLGRTGRFVFSPQDQRYLNSCASAESSDCCSSRLQAEGKGTRKLFLIISCSGTTGTSQNSPRSFTSQLWMCLSLAASYSAHDPQIWRAREKIAARWPTARATSVTMSPYSLTAYLPQDPTYTPCVLLCRGLVCRCRIERWNLLKLKNHIVPLQVQYPLSRLQSTSVP